MADKVLNFIARSLTVLAGGLLLFVTISISYAIATRALGVSSPVWVVQFNEYALLWITFLATAWVLSRGKHVALDVLTFRLSPRAGAYLSCVHGVLGSVVCGVLGWYSFWATWGLYKRGVIDVQATDVPKYLVICVIPLGFLLLAFQFIGRAVENLKLIRSKTASGRGSVDPFDISRKE